MGEHPLVDTRPFAVPLLSHTTFIHFRSLGCAFLGEQVGRTLSCSQARHFHD